MLEVERVAHKLKINKAGNDGKEWRAHMDQTKKYHSAVKESLPEVRSKLERDSGVKIARIVTHAAGGAPAAVIGEAAKVE